MLSLLLIGSNGNFFLYSDASLTITDLWVERGERELFKELSFSADSGDLVHITGANGAGKSSLFKVLLGLLTPIEGAVTFNGVDLLYDRSNFLKSAVYIGHLAGMKLTLTAQENLSWYFPSLSEEMILQTLTELGLGEFYELPLHNLSAGQKRRVALARLWLSDATVWLLDEPFTALDQATTKVLEKKIADHVSLGGIVLLASHLPLSLETKRKVAI